jgi:hypothetical protein
MTKLKLDNPRLYHLFKAHLEDGNSICSFSKYFSTKDYRTFHLTIYRLPEFVELRKKYTKVSRGFVR